MGGTGYISRPFFKTKTMLALHNFCDKPSSAGPASHKIIQLKDGKVFAGTGRIIIQTPAETVFGKDVVDDNETLYFDAEQWKAAKMHSAVNVSREGLVFTAYGKGRKFLGQLMAMDSEKLAERLGNLQYPNVERVLKSAVGDKADVLKVRINADNIKAIADTLKTERLELTWKGENAFSVSGLPEDSGSVIIAMSGVLSEGGGPPAEIIKDEPVEKVSSNVQELREKIQSLEDQLFDANCIIDNKQADIDRLEEDLRDEQKENNELRKTSGEMEDELSALRERQEGILEHDGFEFRVSNELERQVAIEFIECMNSIPQLKLMSYLQNLKELV